MRSRFGSFPLTTVATTPIFRLYWIVVGGSILFGILISIQDKLAIAFLFTLAILGVFFIKPSLLLYYYLLLGAVDLPRALNEMEPASITWIRTTALGVVFAIYVFLLVMKRDVKITKSDRLLIGAILPWTIYLGLSILWSASPYDAMRYYPKFAMALLLAMALRFERQISSEKAVRLLEIGMVLFLLLSTLAVPFKNTLWPGQSWYFEGFSGRHQSKFYLVCIALYAISVWIVGKRRKWALFVGGYSLLLLAFILQRGAFLALIVGGATCYLLSMYRISFRTQILTSLVFIILILGIYTYALTPRFSRYSFYPGYDFSDFVFYMSSGDLKSALRIVDFKGRLEQWSALLNVPKTFFGVGFGTLPYLLGMYFGKYNEAHNDFLQYWIETGYLGFLLYLGMWFFIFKLGQKRSKERDPLLRVLGMSTASYAVGLFAWSFVDHVFDYTHVTGAYLMILAALTVKRAQEIRNGRRYRV